GDPLPIAMKQFIPSIQSCLRSVSADTSIPDQLGITITSEGNELLMYSTNNATLSHSRVKFIKPFKLKNRVILSAQFCKQMVELAKDHSDLKLEIHEDNTSLLTAGKITLFGRTIDVDKPIDFKALLNTNIP